MMRSPCCSAAVYVRGDDGATKWYACAKCKEPCDPVEDANDVANLKWVPIPTGEKEEKE